VTIDQLALFISRLSFHRAPPDCAPVRNRASTTRVFSLIGDAPARFRARVRFAVAVFISDRSPRVETQWATRLDDPTKSYALSEKTPQNPSRKFDALLSSFPSRRARDNNIARRKPKAEAREARGPQALSDANT
jgi:hypothetical protein